MGTDMPGIGERSPDMVPNDDSLMASVQSGNGGAFEQLFRRHWSGLVTLCAAYMPSQSQAEECAQEAMVRLWQSRAFYKRQGSFRAFLFRIGRNTCYEALRRKRSRRGVDVSLDQHSSLMAMLCGSETSPAGRAAHGEQMVRVLAAMDALSPEHREALTLRFLNEMSVAEIADLLGVPEGTIKSRVHYGLLQIRKALAREGPQRGVLHG